MRIGIIGKTGSGKSTAARLLSTLLNYRLIDIDQIAREVVELYPAVLTEVAEAFGTEYVAGNALNRAALGKLVFSDSGQLTKLNGIFFKYIRQEIIRRTADFGSGYLLEGAVLTELPGEKLYDRIIYIYTEPEEALSRLQKRENTPSEVLKNRLASQSKYDNWLTAADFAVSNNGTESALQRELEKLIPLLLAD